MKLRHITALALASWFLMTPASSLTAADKSTLLTYANKAYGFSFQYPSDCTLTEGAQVKLDWGYLGPVGDSLVYGVTVAAVELPYGPYRETDFGMAFLKVSVDTSLNSPRKCNRSAFHGLGPVQRKPGKFPTVKIGENLFTEAIEENAGLGHDSSAQYYHTLRNSTCYEFQLGLGTNSAGGERKQVDQDVVFRRLKAILATVTLPHTTGNSPLGGS